MIFHHHFAVVELFVSEMAPVNAPLHVYGLHEEPAN